MANLSLVLSLATLAVVGCQSERADVGGSAAAQGPAAQAGSGGNGGGSGGEGGATGSGGDGAGGDPAGAGGAAATALAEACDTFCAASEALPCHPDDCVAECVVSTPGCEAEFTAFLTCIGPSPDLTCSGGELVVSPEGCPDEFAALDACF